MSFLKKGENDPKKLAAYAMSKDRKFCQRQLKAQERKGLGNSPYAECLKEAIRAKKNEKE